MHKSNLKSLAFALCAILLATQIFASSTTTFEGHVQVPIKASQVQGEPKTNSIQASINGHTLTVTFTENLGNVQIDFTTASGGAVSFGDEYYGEFEVTD